MNFIYNLELLDIQNSIFWYVTMVIGTKFLLYKDKNCN